MRYPVSVTTTSKRAVDCQFFVAVLRDKTEGKLGNLFNCFSRVGNSQVLDRRQLWWFDCFAAQMEEVPDMDAGMQNKFPMAGSQCPEVGCASKGS